MLTPNWYSVPLGPWLRREPDKRLYFLLFRPDAYIKGIRRLYVTSTASRVEATTLTDEIRIGGTGPRLVVFRNAISGDADRYFPTFLGHHDLLRQELVRITRPRFVPAPQVEPHVAIHVRLGDFAKVDVTRLHLGAHSARLPIDWYVAMLAGIRSRLGSDVRAVVYSDGRDADLAPLLSLNNVRRASDGSAITHMLAIAQANLLIGTGSGMSIWGAFLGQVPRLCFPGQRLLRTFVEDGREPECELARDIPDAFATIVGHKLLATR